MAKKHLIAIALMGVAIFLAYSNSLSGTWAMDDIVAGKPVALKDIKDLGRILKGEQEGKRMKEGQA